MVFSFVRTDKHIEGVIEYNAALYTNAYIERVICHFNDLLKASLFNVDIILAEISILSAQEKKQLLIDFNDTQSEHLVEKTFHQLFQEQVERTPNLPAVKYMDIELTYRELNENANQMARILRRCGIQKDKMVGILLNRSIHMMGSIIAVWKAGGAYIPLDTQYPAQRLNEIIEDSGIPVLITQTELLGIDMEKQYGVKIIEPDEEIDVVANEDKENLDLTIDINSLAYVIYTSGSTGKPKGVMVEQLGMMNHIWAKIEELHMSETSIVVQNASHTFDISVWQFFAAPVLGGKTVIYPGLLILDPRQFIAMLEEDHITILEVVPSYLAILLENLDPTVHSLGTLTYLLVTGETLKSHLVNLWFEKYQNGRCLWTNRSIRRYHTLFDG